MAALKLTLQYSDLKIDVQTFWTGLQHCFE